MSLYSYIHDKSTKLARSLTKSIMIGSAILGLNYTANAAPITIPNDLPQDPQFISQSSNYPHNTISEAAIRGNAERAEIGLEALAPIKDKVFVRGKIAADTDLGLVGTLGLGHRMNIDERTYGINAHTDQSDKQSVYSLGLEAFSKERRLAFHANGYMGEQNMDSGTTVKFTGADIIGVGRILTQEKSEGTLKLNALLGAYAFTTDEEQKRNITGIKAGLELRVPLKKDSWELVADLMGYSEEELAGANYTAFVGVRYGNKVGDFEPVRRQTPVLEEIAAPAQPVITQTTRRTTPTPSTPTHTGDGETPTNPTHTGDGTTVTPDPDTHSGD